MLLRSLSDFGINEFIFDEQFEKGGMGTSVKGEREKEEKKEKKDFFH